MHAGRSLPHLVLIATLALLTRTQLARAELPELDQPELGAGTLTLSARALHSRDSFGQSEWLASIALVIPLERFAAPPRIAEPETVPVEVEAAPAPEREIRIVVTPKLARSAVRIALLRAGHPASRRRLDGLASRAQSSALMPELRLRALRTLDESLRLTPTQTDPYRYTQAGGSSTTFEARLTWKLDRLVFADEELDVERLRGQHAAAARSLVREVLRALVVWQRAEIRANDPELAPDERIDATLDALEAAATLDVLTGGWFSETLERRPRARRRRP